MPLPVCHHPKYQVYLVTAGPWNLQLGKEYVRSSVLDLVKRYYGAYLKKCSVAAEVSDTGYAHFHVAIQLSEARNWKALNRQLRELVESWPKDCDRHTSTRFNYVPVDGHKFRDGNKRGYEVVEGYLKDPKKIKECDDGVIDYDDNDYFDDSMWGFGQKREFIEWFHALSKCRKHYTLCDRCRSVCDAIA